MGTHCPVYAEVGSYWIRSIAKLFSILDNGNWVSGAPWVGKMKKHVEKWEECIREKEAELCFFFQITWRTYFLKKLIFFFLIFKGVAFPGYSGYNQQIITRLCRVAHIHFVFYKA